MLSFNVTHALQECNAALPKLYATQIQAAMHRKLVAYNGQLSETDPRWQNLRELQDAAMAADVTVNQSNCLDDKDIDKLASLLFEAYETFVNSFDAAGFPEPGRAATMAMKRYVMKF
jgi:hypothetical protein